MDQKVSFLITQFIRFLNEVKGSSPTTLKNYQRYLEHFSQSFPELLIKDLDAATINKYQKILSNPQIGTEIPYKITTQNYHLIALRSFLNFLENSQKLSLLVKPNQVALSKTPIKSSPNLSNKDKEILHQTNLPKTPEGLRNKLIIELLLCSGLKTSQLVSLNRGDIEPNFRQIKLTNNRDLILTPACSLVLEQYLDTRRDTHPALFIRLTKRGFSNSDLRLSPRSVERIVKNISSLSNSPTTPNSLRKSYAENLFLEESNLNTIQQNLGHLHRSSTRNLKKSLA